MPEKERTPGQPEAVDLSTTAATVSVSYSRAGLRKHGIFLVIYALDTVQGMEMVQNSVWHSIVQLNMPGAI